MNIYSYKLVIDELSSQYGHFSGNLYKYSDIFLWNIVIKFAVPIKACILIEMRLNLSKCGPLTKYSLIFCYILADLKMSLCTIYEAPGKLCFLYPTPFSSIFFFAPIFYLILHEFCPSYTIYIILLSDFPLPENGNGYFE